MNNKASNNLCIYHNTCQDGFSAAWVVRKALGDNVDFFGGIHGKPHPDIEGKDVIMVDFSYKRPIVESMLEKANSIKILDHHKSAMEDLGSLSAKNLLMEFDMDKSGATVTWDHYLKGQLKPQLLLHVEDRDLWKFKLEKTKEISEAFFSYEYDFAIWDKLMSENPSKLAQDGEVLVRKHMKDILEFLPITKRKMRIGNHIVEAANMPYFYCSEAGAILAKDNPFGATYYDTPTGRIFSLRSREDRMDVSEIAKIYGGGGHRNASGFRVTFEQAKEFEL